MPRLNPGDQIDYIVTYLEMDARPTAPAPPMPVGQSLALIAAKEPPSDYFLYLYGAVGGAYEWTDWLNAKPAELDAFLSDEKVELFTVMVDGWPGGFFILDTRVPGTCDLALFGLVPQAMGRGLGSWLIANAVHMGWDRPGVEKMTVNTNTLDHPRALALYQKAGFVPVRREAKTRRLSRSRKT